MVNFGSLTGDAKFGLVFALICSTNFVVHFTGSATCSRRSFDGSLSGNLVDEWSIYPESKLINLLLFHFLIFSNRHLPERRLPIGGAIKAKFDCFLRIRFVMFFFVDEKVGIEKLLIKIRGIFRRELRRFF